MSISLTAAPAGIIGKTLSSFHLGHHHAGSLVVLVGLLQDAVHVGGTPDAQGLDAP